MLKKLFLLTASSLIMITGCKKAGEEAAQQAMPPTMVIVYEAELGDVTPREVFIGKVEAANKAAITARVGGFLERLNVREGDFVKKDQLLFVIEKSQYLAIVKQADAALAQAKAGEYNAKLQLERGAALLKSEGISRSAYDNLEASHRIASANVAAAQATLDTARLNLSYTDVRSPIEGKVGFINANLGETVSPDRGVITNIIASDLMYVLFSVTDRQIQTMRAKFAQDNNISLAELADLVELEIQLSDGSIYPTKGRMNFVDNTVGGLTDSIMMRAVFENPKGLLTNGQTVTVNLLSKERQAKLLVPQVAVLSDIGGRYVLVVSPENMVERRQVIAGAIQPSTTAGVFQVVESGLTEGEKVIIEGVQKVRPGATVTPMTRGQHNAMMEAQKQAAGQNQQ